MSVTYPARLCGLLISLLLATFAGPVQSFAAIDAVPGKKYRLTKSHGPVMIMVASFKSNVGVDVRHEGRTSAGRPLIEIADELVLELRKQGLPAYTYYADGRREAVTTVQRRGELEQRRTLRSTGAICVVAGNYKSFDDERLAQPSLEWVKKYNPQALASKDAREALMGGVGFVATPGRPMPLSGAFLTYNPMLSPEEMRQAEQSDVVKALNSGVMHSLAENKGKYTLVVAQFLGKSYTEVKQRKSAGSFLIDNDLNEAGQQANDLAAALRQDLDPEKEFRNIEAYVWHDEFRSVVTVGSFDSPNDPEVRRYQQLFGAGLQAGQSVDVRYLAIPGGGNSGKGFRIWTFDPTPRVMPVPKL